MCVSKLNNINASGADEKVNEFMKYGGGFLIIHDGYVV